MARMAAATATANAPFWILGSMFFFDRAIVNLDIALALVALSFSTVTGALLLVAVWCIDLLVSQSLTYHFGSPWEFLRSAQYVFALDINEYLTRHTVIMALPFVICGFVAFRLVRSRPALWRSGGILTAVPIVVDAFSGHSMLFSRSTLLIPFNIAGSPTTSIVLAQWGRSSSMESTLRRLPNSNTVQGLLDIPKWVAAHPDRSVLFVIVESLGVPRNPALRDWLETQLTGSGLSEFYRIQKATLPFSGATTSGELRSLCALKGRYQDLDATIGTECLPSQMRSLGLSTTGLHGFSGQMFDRKSWWPMIGIQTFQFVDSPLIKDLPLCGSVFHGLCDEQLIKNAVDQAIIAKQFVYLLTLNTHVPLTSQRLPSDLTSLCEQWEQNHQACEMVSALGAVLQNLRVALKPAMPRPLVIIVGDHSPQFAKEVERNTFNNHEVLAFVLNPDN
jgi:hypothetical protein